MPPKRIILAAVATALLTACAQNPNTHFDSVQHSVTAATGQHVEWFQGKTDEAALHQRVEQLLAQPLTADSAVALAYLNDPQVQATLEDLGIGAADVVQAGLLKNPVFSIGIEFPGRPHTRVDMSAEAQLVDLLLLPARKKNAAAHYEQLKQTVISELLKTAKDTRIAFYRAQAAADVIALQHDTIDANQLAAELSDRLATAGNIRPLDHDMDASELAMSHLDLLTQQNDAADAREEVALHLGLDANATEQLHFAPLPEFPVTDDATPSAASLEEQAITHRPDLLAAKQNVEVAGQILGYSNFDAMLNGAAIGVSSTRDPDIKSTVGPTITVPLPLFDQGQAAVARAQATLRQSRDQYAALALQVRSEVRRARAMLETYRARAAYCEKTLLPLRQKILRQSLVQYNGMFASMTELLHAKHDELDARRLTAEARRDYWIAHATLEATIAAPLPTIDMPKNTPAPKLQPDPKPTAMPGMNMPMDMPMHGDMK